jgi:acetyl-CoA carboxylase biotin carboxyl carrier protein
MDLKLVKKFISLAKKEGVESLSLDDGETKISVKLPVVGQVATQVISQASSTIQQESIPNAQKNSSQLGEDTVEVSAPVVGTFYSSSSPDEPAFVSIGSKVSKGTTLCIIEAMKIMNEIEADVDGEIVDICIENEEFVEFGQVLFTIKKS